MGLNWQSLKGKPWLAQISTVLALAVLFLLYIQAYVPSRVDYLRSRNFRQVADLSDQIREIFANLQMSIVSAASAATNLDTQPPAAEKPQDRFRRYLANIQPPLEITAAPELAGGSRAYRCAGVHCDFDSAEAPLYLAFTNGLDGFQVRTSLSELLRPVVGRFKFADVLILKTNREILFQAARTAARATNFLSASALLITKLPGALGGTNASDFGSATLLEEVELAGERHKAFSQPLQLLVGGNEEGSVRWVVCGLVRAADFAEESHQMFPTVMLFFIFLAGAVLLSWPFMNVAFCRPWAALRTAHVLWVLASGLIVCSSLVGVLLYANGYRSSEREQDESLRTLAKQLLEHLQGELRSVEEALTYLDRRWWEQTVTAKARENPAAVQIQGRILLTQPDLAGIYPAFSDVVWVDSDGMQMAKWVPVSQPPELVSVKDRPYFQVINRGGGWAQAAFNPGTPGAGRRFYLEPIVSRTRNENIAVYSRRFSVAGPPPADAEPVARRQSRQPAVSTITFKPLTLFYPLLPEGYGFCLLEENGRVLFHSETSRNLRENLLVETGHDRRLLSALQTRTEADFECTYLNEKYHMFVKPFAGVPWTIVTFRNERPVAAAHRNMVFMASALFAVYFAVMVFWVSLGSCLLGRGNGSIRRPCLVWLWRDPNAQGKYEAVVAWSVMIILISLAALLWAKTPAALFGWGMLLPGLAVVPGYWVAVRSPVPARLHSWLERLANWKRGIGRAATGFGGHHPPSRPIDDELNGMTHWICLALGLILLAMLPSFACYKIAFLKETEALLKTNQLNLARALQERPARIEERVRKLDASAWETRARAQLGRFLRKDWNSYYTAAWNTRREPGMPPASTRRAGPTLFERCYAAARPAWEETALAAGGLIYQQAADGSWNSRIKGDRLYLERERRIEPGEFHPVCLSSRLVRAGWLNSPKPPFLELEWELVWYPAALLVLAAPFVVARFVGRRIGLSELDRMKTGAEEQKAVAQRWNACTDEEKITLYQAVQYGFVHSHRPELGQLHERGWICFKPELRVKPELEGFVSEQGLEDGSSLDALKTNAPASPFHWLSIRSTIGLGLTAVAIFLFFTQREFWQLALAFLSSFATVSNELSKTGWVFGKSGEKE